MPLESSDGQSVGVGALPSSHAHLWGAVQSSDVKLILSTRPNAQHAVQMQQQPQLKKVCRPQRTCVVRREQQNGTGDQQLALMTSEFSLHTTVLSSESPYFEARFSRWDPKSSLVTETLEDSREMVAAPHVLKFMYTSQLPPHGGILSDSMLLLDLIKVSERWDASSCITVSVEALRALPAHLFPISDVLVLSSELCVRADIQLLQKEAKLKLLDLYGDVPAVIRNPVALAELHMLPHVTMLELLTSRNLSTDHEASVLVLLWSWIQQNRDSCSSKQIQTLKQAVHYIHLTEPYICEVLSHLSELSLSHKEKDKLRMRKIVQDTWYKTSIHAGNMFAWSQPDRGSDALMSLKLEVSRAQLLTLAEEMAKEDMSDPDVAIRSERVFGFGYDWRLSLQRSDHDNMGLDLELEAFVPMGSEIKVRAACQVKFILPKEARDTDAEDEQEPHRMKGYVTSSILPAIKVDVMGVEYDPTPPDWPWAKCLDAHDRVMNFGVEFSIFESDSESEEED